MKICNQCGAQAADNAAFCAQCEAPLASGVAPPSPQFLTQPAQAKAKTSVWVWILVGLLGVSCTCFVMLAAILFPVFESAKKQAKATLALSQAKQVDLAVLMYLNDSDDVYPSFVSSGEIVNRLTPYFKVPESTPERVQALQASASSYVWNVALSGGDVDTLPEPGAAWVLHSKNADGTERFDIAFADGHVKRVSREELSTITAKPTQIEKPTSLKK